MFPSHALNDPEGARVPPGLPPVIDAHVHVFPPRVFQAVWRWFDNYGWPIRYKLQADEVIEFLLSRGIERVVALQYSHTPGMARLLNEYMAAICAQRPQVIGAATVLPGEPGAVQILEDGFAKGLRAVKLHCHVQCFSPDADELEEIYTTCERSGRPIVMHAGREPTNPKYRCDPHQLCSAERVGRVLRAHPKLKLCIPHLGVDEYNAYQRLLERNDNLWLDTTMVLADYFPLPAPLSLLRCRPDRILYGTDFPNIPYAWDRELKKLLALDLPPDALEGILGRNALSLFGGV
jgi:predicted TIM-barrel fold metal-dependent hydrolase